MSRNHIHVEFEGISAVRLVVLSFLDTGEPQCDSANDLLYLLDVGIEIQSRSRMRNEREVQLVDPIREKYMLCVLYTLSVEGHDFVYRTQNRVLYTKSCPVHIHVSFH